jgi:hypothetical protein
MAIQEVVEKALGVLFHGDAIDARAAGRTDAAYTPRSNGWRSIRRLRSNDAASSRR